jgi:hypothetical protein
MLAPVAGGVYEVCSVVACGTGYVKVDPRVRSRVAGHGWPGGVGGGPAAPPPPRDRRLVAAHQPTRRPRRRTPQRPARPPRPHPRRRTLARPPTVRARPAVHHLRPCPQPRPARRMPRMRPQRRPAVRALVHRRHRGPPGQQPSAERRSGMRRSVLCPGLWRESFRKRGVVPPGSPVTREALLVAGPRGVGRCARGRGRLPLATAGPLNEPCRCDTVSRSPGKATRMIARLWRGAVSADDAEAYARYVPRERH